MLVTLLHRAGRPAAPVALLVSLLVGATGCGGREAPATKVTGTVKLDGQPLPGGKVIFVFQDGKSLPQSAIISANGQYTIPNAPEGPVKIKVEGPGRPSVPKEGDPPLVKVPDKYLEIATSGLEHTVIKGEQTKDLNLTSS